MSIGLHSNLSLCGLLIKCLKVILITRNKQKYSQWITHFIFFLQMWNLRLQILALDFFCDFVTMVTHRNLQSCLNRKRAHLFVLIYFSGIRNAPTNLQHWRMQHGSILRLKDGRRRHASGCSCLPWTSTCVLPLHSWVILEWCFKFCFLPLVCAWLYLCFTFPSSQRFTNVRKTVQGCIYDDHYTTTSLHLH